MLLTLLTLVCKKCKMVLFAARPCEPVSLATYIVLLTLLTSILYISRKVYRDTVRHWVTDKSICELVSKALEV